MWNLQTSRLQNTSNYQDFSRKTEKRKMATPEAKNDDQDFYLPGVEIITKIGQGAQGSAYKVVYNKKLACAKKYSRFEFLSMEKEIKMLRAAQKSGSVPKFFEAFEKEGQKVIVMELVKGKNLFDLMEFKFPNKTMHQIVYKLVKATKKLNSTGVIHNDLKLDNVMVNFRTNRVQVKIIDLGRATFEGESPYPGVSTSKILNHSQLDPSLANGGPSSEATDLYSLGQILLDISRDYECPIYKKYAELLCSHSGFKIDRKDFLEENCELCCKTQTKAESECSENPESLNVNEELDGVKSFNPDSNQYPGEEIDTNENYDLEKPHQLDNNQLEKIYSKKCDFPIDLEENDDWDHIVSDFLSRCIKMENENKKKSDQTSIDHSNDCHENISSIFEDSENWNCIVSSFLNRCNKMEEETRNRQKTAICCSNDCQNNF